MHFPKNKEFSRLLEKAKKHYSQNRPFVLFRKPNEAIVSGIFQNSDALYEVKNFEERGFVFAPFDWKEKKILIQQDDSEQALFQYKPHESSHQKPIEKGRSNHIELLNRTVQLLKSEKLQKVVLSRRIIVDTTKNPFDVFTGALHSYRNAFCYIWYHPKAGLWIGASPETLLYTNNSKIESVSLAGTKKIKPNISTDWSVKEFEEQQLVTDYIETYFHKHLTEVKITGPRTINAGNLQHLKSKISGIKGNNFSLADLLKDLHPTPAICGLPKNEAFEFIKKNENYHREYYTGFMGELNVVNNHDSHLFVNLRCLQIKNAKAIIYVGGGITSKSDPHDEWAETQNKSLTMLKLL